MQSLGRLDCCCVEGTCGDHDNALLLFGCALSGLCITVLACSCCCLCQHLDLKTKAIAQSRLDSHVRLPDHSKGCVCQDHMAQSTGRLLPRMEGTAALTALVQSSHALCTRCGLSLAISASPHWAERTCRSTPSCYCSHHMLHCLLLLRLLELARCRA